MTYAAFGLLDGTASLTGDAFRQRGNFSGKGIVRDDLVDEADAQGLCGIDHVAREEQQGGRAPAHQTGQALGAAESGRDAEADFGLAEAGLFGCDAGTTPISSLPLVSSYASGLTFGEITFFINLLFVAAQWLLLRKSINKLLLLSQIPITFAFSYFIDTSMQITEFLSSDIYWKCFAVSMLGNVVLGSAENQNLMRIC